MKGDLKNEYFELLSFDGDGFTQKFLTTTFQFLIKKKSISLFSDDEDKHASPKKENKVTLNVSEKK